MGSLDRYPEGRESYDKLLVIATRVGNGKLVGDGKRQWQYKYEPTGQHGQQPTVAVRPLGRISSPPQKVGVADAGRWGPARRSHFGAQGGAAIQENLTKNSICLPGSSDELLEAIFLALLSWPGRHQCTRSSDRSHWAGRLVYTFSLHPSRGDDTAARSTNSRALLKLRGSERESKNCRNPPKGNLRGA